VPVGRADGNRKNFRQFSASELKDLAIGQINLKNLRLGAMYLQKAVQLSPNDVMLASQVNALKIRLAEIEQQASAPSSPAKGRKFWWWTTARRFAN
jgi:hypothetical protein